MKTLICTLLFAFGLLVPGPTATATEDWSSLEPVVESIERLHNATGRLSASVKQTYGENDYRNPEEKVQILCDTTRGLQKAVCLLKERFFDGADQIEITEQLRLVEGLANRVKNAAKRVVVYGCIRESQNDVANQLDFLKKTLGF